MSNNTHSIIFELQENLEKIKSAKEQVDFFRKKSNEITNGISETQLKFIEHLEKIKLDYENRVNDLKKQLDDFLSKVKEENTESIQQVASKSEEIIAGGTQEFKDVSAKIETSNNDKIKAINELLEHYKNVVEASSSLISTLTTIDFPSKLEALSSKSQTIIETINGSKHALEIKINDSENKTLMRSDLALEKILENNNEVKSSLSEKLEESSRNITTTTKSILDEQEKQINSSFNNLNTLIEKQYSENLEILNQQNKEIKTLKVFLIITICLVVILSLLNYIKT